VRPPLKRLISLIHSPGFRPRRYLEEGANNGNKGWRRAEAPAASMRRLLSRHAPVAQAATPVESEPVPMGDRGAGAANVPARKDAGGIFDCRSELRHQKRLPVEGPLNLSVGARKGRTP
jgi:hypothetical protein